MANGKLPVFNKEKTSKESSLPVFPSSEEESEASVSLVGQSPLAGDQPPLQDPPPRPSDGESQIPIRNIPSSTGDQLKEEDKSKRGDLYAGVGKPTQPTFKKISLNRNVLADIKQANARILEIDEYLEKNRNRDLGDANAQIKRSKLKKEKFDLIKNQEKLSSEYIAPFYDEVISKIINEDGSVNSEFIDEDGDIYGFKVPNLKKIREVSRGFMDYAITSEDESFIPKIQKQIESAINFNLNVPRERLETVAEDKFKELSGGMSFGEAVSSKASEDYNKKVKPTIDGLFQKLDYAKSEISESYSSSAKKLEDEATKQIELLSSEYDLSVEELRALSRVQGADIGALNKDLERINKDYQSKVNEIIETQQEANNALLSKANRNIRDNAIEISNQVKLLTDKFISEYDVPKDIMDLRQKAYADAASDVYEESLGVKKKVIEITEQINPLKSRVITSMLSGLASSLKSMANGLGFEAEAAADMAQYFTPSIDPIKSFKDLTISKLKESSGNLIGSMTPSILASSITAIATKSAPTAVRVLTVGMAGWGTETLDISGRAYRDALEKTGSEEAAEMAASETIDSQLLLLPTYAIDALPFIGAFKKIKNPALRIGTGGVVEYAQELTQEYPQNLAEKAISETGDYTNMWEYADVSSFEETAANLIPVSVLGMAGAARTDTRLNLKEGRDDIIDFVHQEGKEKAMLSLASMYNSGLIDKDDLSYGEKFISELDLSNAPEYNKKLEEINDVSAQIESETDPVKKRLYSEEKKSLEEEATQILSGEKKPAKEGPVEKKGLKIFVGRGGKRAPDGSRITAHEGVKGVWGSEDADVAATYAQETGQVDEYTLPEDVTTETIEIDPTGKTVDEFRQEEVEAVNNSDAQVVKLRTIDGVIKAGEKRQEQYIIKDKSILKEGAKETDELREQGEAEQTQEPSVGDMREIDQAETTQTQEAQVDIPQAPKLTPQEEGVFVRGGRSKFKAGLDAFRRRYLSARKFLPRSVFAAKEKKDATIAKTLNEMEHNVVDFNKALKNYKGDKQILVDNFDKFIRGQEIELPDEFIEIGNTVRNQVDGLSQQLIDEGLVTEFQSQKIKDNIGEYLTRSYAIFDQKNWKDKVRDEVKQKARNFLKNDMLKSAIKYKEESGDNRSVDEILDTIVDQRMEELLNRDGAKNFIRGSKLGSKDLGILKRRKDIPFEIRALLGEYSDPMQNYARTVYKLTTLAENAKFLNQIKDKGMGKFFFEESDINRPPEFNTQIATERTETMSPLNGLYTTKEIAEAFENNPEGLPSWLEPYMALIGTVKWVKTIGSLTTQMKNFFGNLGFMAINGHWRVGEMGNAIRTVSDDITSMSNRELRKKMNEYIGLGIVKQSAGLGEIRDMFKDAGLNERTFEAMYKREQPTTQKIKRGVLKVKKKAEDLYQGVDDMFKIVAYENEMSRHSEAYFNKPKGELTQEELDFINPIVVEKVKNTYPTYDRVPEAIQMIRRFPFVGNFVSFQAEAWRTAYNTAALANKELRSDNPKIRKIGGERLAGILVYEGVKNGFLAYFGMAAGTGIAGIFGAVFNSDDQDEKDEDVRRFVARWSRYSDLIVLKADEGRLQYIDFSSSDPHGGIHQVFNSFAENDGSIEAFANGIYQVIEPFVGEEIATEALRSILANETPYGGPIYNPEDTIEQIAKDITAYSYKVIELGTVKTIRKIYGADDKMSEIIASMFGFRVYDVDLADQFGFKASDMKKRLKDAKKIYNKQKYSETATQEEIDDAYERSNQSSQELYRDLHDLWSSAIRLGADPVKLAAEMKDAGLSGKEREWVVSGKPFYFER